MSDEITDVVQPDVGQGDGGTGGEAPWSTFVNRIPEDLRDEANTFFKEREADFTRRSQEHADFRKQWEPLKDSGIHELPADRVQWLTQFSRAVDENPQAVYEWAQQYAQENGITVQQAVDQAEAGSGEFEYDDPAAQFEQKLTPIQQQVQELVQRFERQDEKDREAAAAKHIESQFEALKVKHPDEFDEFARGEVEQRVFKYLKSDPQNAVPRAWADFQAARNEMEKRFLQGKANQGTGAEGGGVPDVTTESPKTLAEAHTAAVELMRSMRTAQQ